MIELISNGRYKIYAINEVHASEQDLIAQEMSELIEHLDGTGKQIIAALPHRNAYLFLVR